MSEAKEKDRILAEIKAFKPLNEIEGLRRHLYDLEQAGFITVKYDTEKNPIFIRITTNGKAFLESGGYARLSKAQTRSSAKRLFLRIIENVAVAMISGYAGWMLRGCTQSDNPECTDASVLINDSTSLSQRSSSGLNEDSVASRAKWSGVSLDNAKSTLDNDSMRILEIETSAKHSNVRDESKAMPSGK